MWTFYWTMAGTVATTCNSRYWTAMWAPYSTVCNAVTGLTVPFGVKALLEANREPTVKHPPTVKEVRATGC